METNIDDMNPEFYDYIMDKLFQAGALDVFYTPIQMKKSRPATRISALIGADSLQEITNILLQESTSLGVRVIDDIYRFCLDREFKTISTPWGEARVKIGKKGDEILNISPEYEDCRALAEENDVPLKKIYRYLYDNFTGNDH